MKISDLCNVEELNSIELFTRCFYEKPMSFDCFDETPTQTLNTITCWVFIGQKLEKIRDWYFVKICSEQLNKYINYTYFLWNKNLQFFWLFTTCA